MASSTVIETLGDSIVVAPAIVVGTTATGGYLAEYGAEWFETKYNS